MNVFEKLQAARVKLQNSKLKKSGKNGYSGFTYYELADFIPTVNSIFDELKLFSNFSIIDGVAYLTIINSEKTDEQTQFVMPTTKLELKGCTAIQALGGVNTYCKRYLYLNALEIVEADMLDAKAGTLQENNDIDIIAGLETCDNIVNLNRYFKEYEKKVSDLPKFQKKYTEVAHILKQKV